MEISDENSTKKNCGTRIFTSVIFIMLELWKGRGAQTGSFLFGGVERGREVMTHPTSSLLTAK